MPVPDQTATFRFSKDSSYRLLPVNCIWGGLTPRGDVLAHLCYESQALPETVTHSIEHGTVGEELERNPEMALEFRREAFAGMVLTAEQAFSIGQWLMAKSKEAGFQPKPANTNGAGDGTTH